MDQFGPVPPLAKNQLKSQHATFKGVDEVKVEMSKMHKPVNHYDEVVDPETIKAHRQKMMEQLPEQD